MILGMLQLANILGDLFLNFELNTSYRASSRITVVITSKTQGNSWVISQQVLFFNAFKLGTRSKKNQVFSNDEALTSNLAFKGGAKRKFSLLIGRCLIPLLNGNLYLMVPSFISMMAPTVLRKCLPK